MMFLTLMILIVTPQQKTGCSQPSRIDRGILSKDLTL